MTPAHIQDTGDIAQTINPDGASSIVLVCEHASHHIPARFDGLGLSPSDFLSHAAWDPGALAVAKKLSDALDATLIAGRVSRLVYDCNRPPEAEDAMPSRSEVIDIPGNRNLSATDRASRIDAFYRPFHAMVKGVIGHKTDPILLTIHSFTPVFHGQLRTVEVGVLHDSDTRLADAMLHLAKTHTDANVQRNRPYGPEDGVTHTLKEHAIRYSHLNIMLEIRNDLIASEQSQADMAEMITGWLQAALVHLSDLRVGKC